MKYKSRSNFSKIQWIYIFSLQYDIGPRPRVGASFGVHLIQRARAISDYAFFITNLIPPNQPGLKLPRTNTYIICSNGVIFIINKYPLYKPSSVGFGYILILGILLGSQLPLVYTQGVTSLVCTKMFLYWCTLNSTYISIHQTGFEIVLSIIATTCHEVCDTKF